VRTPIPSDGVLAERSRALGAALAAITDDQRTAIVPVRHRGLRLRRDRRDDRRVAGHRQIAHPSGPARATRSARGRMELFRG
jgi:hypothetical protein